MARHLLVVALGVDFAHAGSARQAANAITAQNARNASVGDFYAVIAREIPDDPDRSEMIFAAQVEDFVNDLRRRLVGRVIRNGFFINQPGFAALLVGSFPAIEG